MQPIDVLLDQVEWKEIPGGEGSLSDNDNFPYATHEGVLSLGAPFPDMKVYQLNTGERIINADDLENFFGGME